MSAQSRSSGIRSAGNVPRLALLAILFLASLAAVAYPIYVDMPATIDSAAGDGWSSLAQYNTSGIILFAAMWMIALAFITFCAIINLTSDPDHGRVDNVARFAAVYLITVGSVLISGLIPAANMDLVLDHIVPSDLRDSAFPLVPIALGLVAIAAALLISAARLLARRMTNRRVHAAR